MKATKFLSKGIYMVLPTRSNPRVFLVVGTAKMAQRSFDLYNPFSKKGKLLKIIVRFLCVYCNPLAQRLLPVHRAKKSKLLKKIEKEFQKSIQSSAYLATNSQKVVLQLQDSVGVFGYLKFAKKEFFVKRLLNEKRALGLLSRVELAPRLIYSGNYKKRPFLVIENLTGTIAIAEGNEYRAILKRYEKSNRFKLAGHPRILQIKKKLSIYGLEKLETQLDTLCVLSKESYLEVYEHGDFAPWNLIKTNQGLMPFDYEYFEECGLQHLDWIKYIFQIEFELRHKENMVLINAIKEKVVVLEFKLLFQVFLIKEVINKYEEQEDFGFETALLKLVAGEKA